jgi:hypothetical protein
MSPVQSGCGNQGKNGAEKILIFFAAAFLSKEEASPFEAGYILH